MNQITIRPAILSDLPTLLRFEQDLIATERPFDPTLKADPVQYYDLPALIASPDAELLVAEFGGELIASGYALIKEGKHFQNYGDYAYLGFMYVAPSHRGRGINHMIIDALKKWAGTKGLTEIRLEVYHGNDPAVRAYEKVGFTRYLVEMRMGLK